MECLLYDLGIGQTLYQHRPGCGVLRAHLVVALLESLLGETLPAFRPVNGLSCLQRNIEVAAFDRKIETRVFVLDEVQRDL